MSIAVLSRMRQLGRRHFAPTAPAVAPPVPDVPQIVHNKPTAAQMAVWAGGAMLTKRFPGWYNYINLASLDIRSASSCILGQLAYNCPEVKSLLIRRYGGSPDGLDLGLRLLGAYGAVAAALGLGNGLASVYGFVGSSDLGTTHAELGQAWREYIVALRCA